MRSCPECPECGSRTTDDTDTPADARARGERYYFCWHCRGVFSSEIILDQEREIPKMNDPELKESDLLSLEDLGWS